MKKFDLGRAIAIVVVGIVALVAAFAVLTAVFDTGGPGAVTREAGARAG